MNVIQGKALKGLFSVLARKIQDANSISLYCQNFSNSISLSSKESLFQLIVSELNKNHQKVKIHSYEYIQNLNTALHHKQYKNLKIKKILQTGALANFFSTIAPPNQYQNLQEALEDIEYNQLQQALNQLKIELKQELTNNNSKLGDEYTTIKNDISKDIEEVFAQLQEHFKNINNNQNKQLAKTALTINFTLFVGALSLLVAPVGIGLALTGLAIGTELYSYGKDKDETFSYSLNPILEFLTRKTAMLITLIYPQFHNTTLVLDDGFYEFLGADLFTIPFHQSNINKQATQDSFIAEQFVYYDTLPKNSPTDFDSYINANQNPIQKDQIRSCFLPLKNSLEIIKKSIQEYHHFVYIETPCFNAIKLANFFKTSLSVNNASKTQKGILILSENPTKSNAGLSDYITQSLLSNKIERGTSTNRPTIQSNKDTYDTQRDFSDYKIAIKAYDPSGKAPFILQLAPFAIKQQKDQDAQYVKDYIASCFKQAKDIKQIIKKEIELLKAVFQKAQEVWKSLQDTMPSKTNEQFLVAICFANFLSHISVRFGHIQDFQIQWEEEQCLIKYANKSICIKDFEVIKEQITKEQVIEKQNFIQILKTHYELYITSLKEPIKNAEKALDIPKQINQEIKLSGIQESLVSVFVLTDLVYAGTKGWDFLFFKLSEVALGLLQDGVKSLYSPSLSSLISTAFSALLNYFIQNKKDLFKQEYEWLIHQYFTYPYDLPLALKRDFHQMQESIPSVFYPIKVKPTLFCIDLNTTFFGGKMDSSSYENQLGWLYKIPTETSLILRILKYIIIDELRSGKLNLQKHISDEEFFQRDLSTINIKDYMFDMDKEEHMQRVKQYSSDSREGETTSPIKAYNTALEFLATYQRNKIANKDHLSIAFLQALDAIGENNIKALYVGTSEESKNKKRPLFVGRLATTIIIEDGLWIG